MTFFERLKRGHSQTESDQDSASRVGSYTPRAARENRSNDGGQTVTLPDIKHTAHDMSARQSKQSDYAAASTAPAQQMRNDWFDDRTSAEENPASNEVVSIPVDVYETREMVVIYAAVPGADMNHISVSIAGEANIVILEGTMLHPDAVLYQNAVPPTRSYFTHECAWGSFYRRIILPTQVDRGSATAEIQNGTLLLRLPLQYPVRGQRQGTGQGRPRKLQPRTGGSGKHI